jgi:hypothetical protein
MRTAEYVEIPPMEAEAMAVPPFGTQTKRPFWDICWRARTALILMALGFGLQFALAVLLVRYFMP